MNPRLDNNTEFCSASEFKFKFKFKFIIGCWEVFLIDPLRKKLKIKYTGMDKIKMYNEIERK